MKQKKKLSRKTYLYYLFLTIVPHFCISKLKPLYDPNKIEHNFLEAFYKLECKNRNLTPNASRWEICYHKISSLLTDMADFYPCINQRKCKLSYKHY